MNGHGFLFAIVDRHQFMRPLKEPNSIECEQLKLKHTNQIDCDSKIVWLNLKYCDRAFYLSKARCSKSKVTNAFNVKTKPMQFDWSVKMISHQKSITIVCFSFSVTENPLKQAQRVLVRTHTRLAISVLFVDLHWMHRHLSNFSEEEENFQFSTQNHSIEIEDK